MSLHLKPCRCENPCYTYCTPVSPNVECAKLLEKNAELIGMYVCWICGGVPDRKPDSYIRLDGGKMALRLATLGIIKDPNHARAHKKEK